MSNRLDYEAAFPPIPPAPLRGRVAGTTDEPWFNISGRRTVDEWSRALASAGKTFGDFDTIIDYGCGCGRALRHLAPLISDKQRLVGLDPDAEAIKWVSENLRVEAHRVGDMPPVDAISTAGADLVVSHSVFTHMPEDVQFAWLEELARIIRPGGLLIASIHGTKPIETYRSTLGHEASEAFSEHMRNRGFFYASGKNDFETPLPSYYGGTFHDIRYIAERWTKDFKMLAWFPVAALDWQDILVFSRN